MILKTWDFVKKNLHMGYLEKEKRKNIHVGFHILTSEVSNLTILCDLPLIYV